MIKVSYQCENDHYTYLAVSGHAESGQYGKDLICAAVSAIMYGLLNGLDQYEVDSTVSETANKIEIKNNTGLEVVDNYLNLELVQLKTIEESYYMFIKVERKK